MSARMRAILSFEYVLGVRSFADVIELSASIQYYYFQVLGPSMHA